MEATPADMDALLSQYAPSDPLLVEAMARDYRAALYRLAISILDEPADAEDAAQETLIKAARSLHQYVIGTNFRAWLYQIAVNTCRAALRKRARRGRLHQVLAALQVRQSPVAGPEEITARHASQVQLWNLVAQLPEKQRLVVILHLAHDLPVAEVAQIVGANTKTVYSRLYAAYQNLRGEIERSGQLSLFEDE